METLKIAGALVVSGVLLYWAITDLRDGIRRVGGIVRGRRKAPAFALLLNLTAFGAVVLCLIAAAHWRQYSLAATCGLVFVVALVAAQRISRTLGTSEYLQERDGMPGELSRREGRHLRSSGRQSSHPPRTVRLTRGEQRHLAKMIPQYLRGGKTKQELVQELVELGADAEWAVRFVDEAETRANHNNGAPGAAGHT